MRLGVDAGGTSTRAVLVDDGGRCLGYGTAGGGNPISWGPERAARAIAAAVAAALRQAEADGCGVTDPSVPDGVSGPAGAVAGRVVLAMAGGNAYSTTGAIESELRSVGCDRPVTIASDLLATFCAGTPELGGYAVVAGTGAAAIRVRDGRVDASADGLGWLLGDAGSGFWIGRRVVRSALAALDSRGPATALTAMLLDELGIVDDGRQDASGRPAGLQAAVDALYRRQPVELSRFAALAFRAAGVGGDRDGADRDGADRNGADRNGGDGVGGSGDGNAGHPTDADAAGRVRCDPIALSILTAARERLVDALAAVRRDDAAGPVVLGGGIAQRLPGLAQAMALVLSGGSGHRDTGGPAVSRSTAGAPIAPDVVTVADGAVGAAVLALRDSGITVDGAVFGRLVGSIARFRDR